MKKHLSFLLFISVLHFCVLPHKVLSQEAGESEASSQAIQPEAKGSQSEGVSDALPVETASSQARQITALRNLLAVNEKRIRRIKRELQQHKQEFTARSERFSALDAELSKQEEQGDNGEEVSSEEQAALQAKWKRARKEFDFIIDLTQTKESFVAVLEQKKAGFEAGMEQLLNPEDFRNRIEQSLLNGGAQDIQGEGEASTAAGAAISHPMLSLLSAVDGGDQASSSVASNSPSFRFDYRSADAAKEVFEKQVALAVEDSNAKLLDTLLTLSNNDLSKMQQLTALLNAYQQQLTEWLQHPDEEAKDGVAPTLALSPQEASRMKRQQQAIKKSLETIQQDEQVVRQTLTGLEEGRARSGVALDKAEAELDEAIRALEFVQSPFAPHRIKRWAVQKLPGILVTLVLIFIVWFLLRIVANRSIKVLEAGSRRGSKEERKERAQTIHRVFRNIISTVVFVVGLILLLDQAGIDVTVLLGSAALIGVAVTFGAQSLIKDYFHGALVLIEDQFRVGNVVKVGDIVGTVEDITLRMMILRDLAGTVHFIPHGEVSKVSNLTYGWARVVFDIGVAYKEQVDRVMELLMEITQKLKSEKEFRKLILGEPEMLGVDELGDSAVVIRFLVKTKPLKQWIIKRELLRRIKNTFDEQGIEIPFPHRTIYMGGGDESGGEASLSEQYKSQ